MAYKQTPGRSPFLKTGRDIPLNMTSPLHQQNILSKIGSGVQHGWNELKSLCRRVATFNEGGVTPPEGQKSFEGKYGGTAVTKMEQREFDYQYNKKKAAEEAAAKKVSGTSGATKGM